ncbi:MAG: class C sortase [Eubacterium sp.]|nr:class C sortase [Eubacterium sp.]
MKDRISTIALVIIFLFGLCLILYPPLSNYYNSFHMTSMINDYQKAIEELDDDTYEQILAAAVSYNEQLVKTQSGLSLPPEMREEYEKQLDVTGFGVMGYIEIKSINVYIPIYHGTDDAALAAGAGHLEGSSLPIGGETAHSVICGHRGLPSAKLFTDLDKLDIGDEFTIYVLDDAYTYEVSDIYIIEPDDASKLYLVEGEDLCTLYTCTPYGINTQRLLLRGKRVDDSSAHLRISSEAYKIESAIAAPIFAVPILLILLIWLIISTSRKKKGGDNTDERFY